MKRKREEQQKTEETIQDRIRKVRLTYRLSQQKFVESLGITQSYLSSIERKNTPSAALLHAISCLYEVNFDWLLTGVGEMFTLTPHKYSPLDADFLMEVIEAIIEVTSDRGIFLNPKKLSLLIVFTYEISFKHKDKYIGKKRNPFLRDTANKLLDFSPFIKPSIS